MIREGTWDFTSKDYNIIKEMLKGESDKYIKGLIDRYDCTKLNFYALKTLECELNRRIEENRLLKLGMVGE